MSISKSKHIEATVKNKEIPCNITLNTQPYNQIKPEACLRLGSDHIL